MQHSAISLPLWNRCVKTEERLGWQGASAGWDKILTAEIADGGG
jgi:hypothetical protein